MSGSAAKILMPSVDELLGIGTTVPTQSDTDKVVEIEISKMHDFNGHPFRVLEDAKMAETVESIKTYGVLMPGIVRPLPARPGEYEIVAGHRRRHASELAGRTEMPVIIRELTDDEATVIMVDSNIQREDLLPSEKAYAYRMKYDALKRMGKETEMPEESTSGRNDQKLAEQTGESRNTIQRYIRLTCLIPELLQMVDEKKLPKNTAAELSYLTEGEQKELLAIISERKLIPSGSQAAQLKEYSRQKNLTVTVMQLVLQSPEAGSGNISLKGKRIRQYFPENYTGKQMEEIIYKLLQEWKDRDLGE